MRKTNGSASPRVVPLRPSANAVDDDDDDAMVVEDHKALVPNDWYQAKFVGHDTAIMFGRASKLFLKFEIADPSHPLNGVRLVRPYRVRRLVGRPGPNGRFVLSAGGDLYRTVIRLLDTKVRKDRISLRPFKSMLFQIRTRTVDKDRDGKELAEPARYSVISDIVDGR